MRLETRIMKTANNAPKSNDRKRKPAALRKLTVKPLDASKVKGGYFLKIAVRGESSDDKFKDSY
jgi:hypothetical protein